MMPWKLQKSGDGYFVVNAETGKRMSKSPLPRARASAQLRLLYAKMNSGEIKEAGERFIFDGLMPEAEKALGTKPKKSKRRGWMPGLAKHLGHKLGGDPHFFTKCMAEDEISQYDQEARASICARAHYYVTGIWPGAHGGANPNGPEGGETELPRPGRRPSDRKKKERRGDVSAAARKRAVAKYGNVNFADETNKKYPVDTPGHIRAAWNYIHQAKNAMKYADGGAHIRADVIAAWKREIDPKGPPGMRKRTALHRKKEVSAVPTAQMGHGEGGLFSTPGLGGAKPPKRKKRMAKTTKGGAGSGYFQHPGRPGAIGGSAPHTSAIGKFFAGNKPSYWEGDDFQKHEKRIKVLRGVLQKLNAKYPDPAAAWDKMDADKRDYAKQLLDKHVAWRKGVIDKHNARKKLPWWQGGSFFKEADAQTTKGGAGSGNFGHAGRPGHLGGSAPGGGGSPIIRAVEGFRKVGEKFPDREEPKTAIRIATNQAGEALTLAKNAEDRYGYWSEITDLRNKWLAKFTTGKEAQTEYTQPHGGAVIFKDVRGDYRWVLFSSSAYQDQDKEIVSTKALEEDCDRLDSTKDYGPLRWWHVPGVDIGRCDFNMVHGRVLIESGTFNSPAVARAVMKSAPKLQVSIGFHHPPSEPDGDGVFHHIRRFERSLTPAGRASNEFTSVVLVKGDEAMATIKEKIEALKQLLGDDKLVESVLAQSEVAQQAAEAAGKAFKEKEDAEAEAEAPAPEAEAETEKAKAKPAPKAEEPEEEEPEEDEEDAEDEEEDEEDDFEDDEEEDDDESKEYTPVFMGDLPIAGFVDMLAESVARALEPMVTEVKSLQKELVTVKEALAAKVAEKDKDSAALTELTAKVEETAAKVKELSADVPKAAKPYIASQDASTALTAEKEAELREKGNLPHADDGLAAFMSNFIGLNPQGQ